MWKFWLVIAGICFVIEAYTVGFFVFWFGIGALIALVISLFCGNFFMQTFSFIISSALLLVLTKPIIKKFVKTTKIIPTNVNRIIGKEGIVLENISPIDGKGKVKIRGEIWSATSDNEIEKDTKVIVTEVNGVKLKVEELNSISSQD